MRRVLRHWLKPPDRSVTRLGPGGRSTADDAIYSAAYEAVWIGSPETRHSIMP